ncbi:unnamed protein product [Brassica rapa]|uniref:PUM-HD domain-containing protein n=1 Tax=Brassica campestris TaxID=3711 RepID=A0A3P6A6V2_BRACM|nr:unnamed protein product [Brassica rapa]VDC88092.1 unnamed protein product [Brassica rapa]
MDNSRSKDTILSRAKDVVESDKLQKVIMEGSRDTSKTHVYEMMIDLVGHQIIEKCTSEQTTHILDIVIQQPIQFVRICGDTHGYCFLQVIVQNCYQIALDQHGSCMLQQCIEKSPREIRDPLISGILANSFSLCTNRYK